MQSDIFLLLPAIFLVAFLYASVGHGGASGYLALMALAGVNSIFMRSSALALNLFVASIAFIQYSRGGYFKWKVLLPFAIASVPASFAGASFTLDDHSYKKLLAVILLFAAARIYGFMGRRSTTEKQIPVIVMVATGGVIGFLSGLMGIGGGILLSPFLLLYIGTGVKETAAISAAFILINSIAGLTGLYISTSQFYHPDIIWWMAAAISGGWIGSWAGSRKFHAAIVKKILSVVLVFAGGKLFFT